MELNQQKTDYSNNKINKNESLILIHRSQNLNYLYPNGHRMTHQTKWFKASRDRFFRENIVA